MLLVMLIAVVLVAMVLLAAVMLVTMMSGCPFWEGKARRAILLGNIRILRDLSLHRLLDLLLDLLDLLLCVELLGRASGRDAALVLLCLEVRVDRGRGGALSKALGLRMRHLHDPIDDLAPRKGVNLSGVAGVVVHDLRYVDVVLDVVLVVLVVRKMVAVVLVRVVTLVLCGAPAANELVQ